MRAGLPVPAFARLDTFSYHTHHIPSSHDLVKSWELQSTMSSSALSTSVLVGSKKDREVQPLDEMTNSSGQSQTKTRLVSDKQG